MMNNFIMIWWQKIKEFLRLIKVQLVGKPQGFPKNPCPALIQVLTGKGRNFWILPDLGTSKTWAHPDLGTVAQPISSWTFWTEKELCSFGRWQACCIKELWYLLQLVFQLGLGLGSGLAQTVKNLFAMQETRIQSLGRGDPLEKGMGIHPSVLVWRTPWTEEPGDPTVCWIAKSQIRLHD